MILITLLIKILNATESYEDVNIINVKVFYDNNIISNILQSENPLSTNFSKFINQRIMILKDFCCDLENTLNNFLINFKKIIIEFIKTLNYDSNDEIFKILYKHFDLFNIKLKNFQTDLESDFEYYYLDFYSTINNIKKEYEKIVQQLKIDKSINLFNNFNDNEQKKVLDIYSLKMLKNFELEQKNLDVLIQFYTISSFYLLNNQFHFIYKYIKQYAFIDDDKKKSLFEILYKNIFDINRNIDIEFKNFEKELFLFLINNLI